MKIPLIKQSIAWRFIIYIIGLVLAMRLMMSLIHHHGIQQLNKRAVDLIDTMATSAPADIRESDIRRFEEAIQDESIRLFLRELLISAGVLGVLIFVVLRMARSITRPISELTHAAGDMRRGNLSGTLALPLHLQDEVGQLAASFASLASTLEQAQKEVNHKVEEIKAAERRLKLFFDNAMDMLAIEDFQGKYIQINEAYARTLGYTSDELLGKSCIDFFHPGDLEASLEKIADLKAGRPVLGFENRMRHRDGHYRSIGWNIVSDPVAQRIYVIGWDVTEHRNAEEEVLRRTAREQERMARNLHNSVGQLLTGLAFKAKSIEQDLRVKGSADPELAASVVRLANLVIDETRSIARNIDPVELQHGLAASLEYLAHSSREVFGVDCQVLHNSDEIEIQRSKAIHLYWIAHEAVTYAIRQGHATRITISLESTPKQLNLTVQDNAPIPARIIDSSGGQEQRIMKYRAQMIGANLIFLDGSPGGRIMKCIVSFPNELLYSSGRSKEDLNNKESRGAI